MITRRLAAIAGLSLALLVALCSPSFGAVYSGKTADFGALSATIANGTLTSFKTQTGRLHSCAGKPDNGSSWDPQDLVYSGPPVALNGGKVHLAGLSKDDYGDPFVWSVDGALSLDGTELTGTASVSGNTKFEKGCVGTWTFDAIIPPAKPQVRRHHTFTGTFSFDLDHGSVTHLTANVGVTCPDTSVLGAMVDTAAYGQDPIRLSKSGGFKLSGAVLDDYGVINHFKLKGHVHGHKATMSYRSTRTSTTNGKTSTCSGHGTEEATSESPTLSAAPSAFFNILPYREGRPGAWTYYLIAKLTGCANAQQVEVKVAGGPTKKTTCKGQTRLGPLAPQHTYTVRVTALRVKHGRVVGRTAAVPATVYLPGEDGDWIRLL